MEETPLKRINKYLTEVGYCSRRAADKLIAEGRVTINGKVPELGTKVSPTDEVRVDGKRVERVPSANTDVFDRFAGVEIDVRVADTAGKAIGTTGGHADPTNGRRHSEMDFPGPEVGIVNSVSEARAAVRQSSRAAVV